MQGYQNGHLKFAPQPGSWNPAFRPDESSDDQMSESHAPETATTRRKPIDPSANGADSIISATEDLQGGPLNPETVQITAEGADSHDVVSTNAHTENVGSAHVSKDMNDDIDKMHNEFSVTEVLNCSDGTNSFPDGIDFQTLIGQPQDTENIWNPQSAANATEHLDTCVAESHNDHGRGSSTWDETFRNDDAAGTDFFSQISSQTKPMYIPPDSESRFDEGVPLVAGGASDSLSQNQAQADAIEAIFKADESTVEDDFFSSGLATQSEEAQRQIPDFQRKSTAEVLSAFDFDVDSPLDPFIDDKASPVTGDVTQENQVKGTEASEASAAMKLGEDELAERWKAFLGDDDLLVEDEELDAPNEAQESTGRYQPTLPEPPVASAPPQFQPPQRQTTLYTPHQPSSTEMIGNIPMTDYFQGQQKRPDTPKASVESFTDKPKAGYQSPYDLPFDVRPKHARPTSRPLGMNPPPMNPPPRSSSMSGSRPPSSSYMPVPPAPGATVPPSVSESRPPPNPLAAPPSSTEPVRTGSFFEELPAVTKSRPSTRGRYTPQPSVNHQMTPILAAPPAPLAPPAPSAPAAPAAPAAPPAGGLQVGDPYSQFQLQPPARLDPYSSLSAPPPPSGPPSSSRYSPQPPSHTGPKTVPLPRYSPAPPQSSGAAGPPRYVSQAPTLQTSVNSLPFQPRTSSPLAQHDHAGPYPLQLRKRDSFPVVSTLQGPDSHFTPPKRSMTQSPGKMVPLHGHVPHNAMTYARPASAHGSRSSTQSAPLHSAYAQTGSKGVTPGLDFIEPMGDQAHDNLQRWKGAPIFKFGFGGTVLSTFPKHIPRYATGQLVPKIKPTVGDIKTCSIHQFQTQDELLDKFPGPLKAKSKKKDVLSWLSAMISSFENARSTGFAEGDPVKQRCQEDHLLLWRVVRVLVEHDGVLEGSPAVETSLQSVFSANTESLESISLGLGSQVGQGVFNRSMDGSQQSDASGSSVMELIYQSLAAGDRQKAVWDAVDRRLWGHAMLISSTLDKSVWKQVTQEFIRREIRSYGENTESLAALYEIFAGNFEESVDELVPLSARAGLQMVSTHAGPGHTKNALEGLDKWKDTLTLILKNRSNQDHQAILALGRLLASYGRVEASHICCLIAGIKAGLTLGGPGEPHANIVLLGADHWQHPATFMNDRKACLLTEVYEFATSVLASPGSQILPHLQAFKLQHAVQLAEEGHKSEAQQYCEAIASSVTSKSALKSPYYNQRFFMELDELSHRLRQAPADDSSSWISKPSMEKVSGSMWAKFNSFVSGDDNEAKSNGSGKAGEGEIGPFAKIAGTPPISRSPSVAEGYGAYVPSSQPIPVSSSTSRYAPNNPYAPYSSSPEQPRGRRSLDAQPSPSRNSYSQRRHSQDPSTPLEANGHGSMTNNIYSSPATIGPYATPPQPNYSPLAPVEEIYSPQIGSPANETPAALQPPTTSFGITQSSYMPSSQLVGGDGETTADVGYQPSSYEPPSLSIGYEPPSYAVETGEGEVEAEHERPEEEKPKKFFMDDDDDDFMGKATQLRSAERERQDREAAEAVRKAAEEDGKLRLHSGGCKMKSNCACCSQATFKPREKGVVFWVVWKERKHWRTCAR